MNSHINHRKREVNLLELIDRDLQKPFEFTGNSSASQFMASVILGSNQILEDDGHIWAEFAPSLATRMKELWRD